MEPIDFTSFEKKIYITASPEKIYRCWATAAGICEWFLSKAVYTRPDGGQRLPTAFIEAGDHYQWEWHNWDGQESGIVLEANGRDQLSFTFAGQCKVDVTLLPKNNKTLVSLKQYEIPLDEASKMNIYMGCSTGWTFWLANMKAYLEHGIMLNETEEDLRKIPKAGMIFVNM